MRNLTKKKDNKILETKHAAKEIFMYLLYIFIFVSCYYIYNYNFDNCELITICTTNCVELESVVNTQPNIWYKCILNDFFNKFTSNSKIINPKFIEIKSDCAVKTIIPLKHNFDTEIVKKSIILNKIQSDIMKSNISEC